MKITVISYKGEKGKSLNLPKEWGEELSSHLLWQAIHVYRERAHTRLSQAKTRAEVNRTKKKVYRQKGTGGARHGARSAPIYVGGGVAHGPRAIKRELKLSQKMRRKALNLSLKLKNDDNNLFAVKDLAKFKKTKEVGNFLKKLDILGKRILFAVSDGNFKSFEKASRNIKNVSVVPFRGLNAYKVFVSGKVFLDEVALVKGKD